MKWVDIDWQVLRGAIGGLCVCILISAIMLGASFYFRNEMALTFKEYNARFRNISQKYLAVDQEERIIRELYPAFTEYYNRGVIGQEKRLNWLETLRIADEKLKLPSLRYQIESREPYTPDYPLSTGGFQVYSSTMVLDVGLLHENDLARLFSELDNSAKGFYRVKKCAINMGALTIKLEANVPNIRADCDLDWFTINLPGDQELVL